MTMDAKQAKAQIDTLVKDAYDKLAQAARISDDSGVGFVWSLEYGMGGSYIPKKQALAEARDARKRELKRRNPDARPEDLERWVEDMDFDTQGGWKSSSADC